MRRFLLTTSVCIALSACASLPFIDQKEEAVVREDASKEREIHRWWEVFNDPLMNRMADSLLKQNLDIQIAGMRIAEARGTLKAAESEWFPSVNLTGSASRGNDQFGVDNVVSISRGGFDAQWEIDLFGQTRSQASAAEARVHARIASADDIRSSMLAELMRTIIEWRRAQETIRETKDLLATQDKQIGLFEARSKAGLVDATFLSRARAERAQTATHLPIAQAAADIARFKIARLLAVSPEQVNLEVPADDSFVVPASQQAVTVDVEVIRQRPDVRALRTEMLAAQGDLAKAEANLWPRLSIGAFFGVRDDDSGLRMADNPIWTLGSSVTAPILNFGRLRGAVDAADAKANAASLSYENGILAALQETQTALADYLNGINATFEQEKALTFRRDTVKLANERFEQGLTDMTDLTTAQSELNQATLTLIERRAAAAIAYIRLQKALGATY